MQTEPNYNSAAVNNLSFKQLGLISLLCILKDIYYVRTLREKELGAACKLSENLFFESAFERRCPFLFANYIRELQKFKILKIRNIKHTDVYTRPKKISAAVTNLIFKQ